VFSVRLPSFLSFRGRRLQKLQNKFTYQDLTRQDRRGRQQEKRKPGVLAAREHEGREAVPQRVERIAGKPARRSNGLKERLNTLWRLRGVPTTP
jgi:hypothetical protein